jgi:hypothetical protein
VCAPKLKYYRYTVSLGTFDKKKNTHSLYFVNITLQIPRRKYSW